MDTSKILRDVPAGRAWAYVGASIGAAVSIAANVAHSYVPPEKVVGDWSPPVGSVIGAVFWPVILFVVIEIFARNRAGNGWWLALKVFGLIPVAVVAAVVSYSHMSGLLDSFIVEDKFTVMFGPLAVDGLMVMATGMLIMTSPRPARSLDVVVNRTPGKIESESISAPAASGGVQNPAASSSGQPDEPAPTPDEPAVEPEPVADPAEPAVEPVIVPARRRIRSKPAGVPDRRRQRGAGPDPRRHAAAHRVVIGGESLGSVAADLGVSRSAVKGWADLARAGSLTMTAPDEPEPADRPDLHLVDAGGSQ